MDSFELFSAIRAFVGDTVTFPWDIPWSNQQAFVAIIRREDDYVLGQRDDTTGGEFQTKDSRLAITNDGLELRNVSIKDTGFYELVVQPKPTILYVTVEMHILEGWCYIFHIQQALYTSPCCSDMF